MARCAAEINEDLIGKTVFGSTCEYGGVSFGTKEDRGENCLEYMLCRFNHSK